jgi:hypothetical protein
MIGVLGFDFRRGLGIFLFTAASRTVLGPTQPPIQWVPGALSPGVKRPGREADHSPPSSAEVKNAWSYTSNPQHVFMAWCLVKHRTTYRIYVHDVVLRQTDITFFPLLSFSRIFRSTLRSASNDTLGNESLSHKYQRRSRWTSAWKSSPIFLNFSSQRKN